jgi:hypothetical protein
MGGPANATKPNQTNQTGRNMNTHQALKMAIANIDKMLTYHALSRDTKLQIIEDHQVSWRCLHDSFGGDLDAYLSRHPYGGEMIDATDVTPEELAADRRALTWTLDSLDGVPAGNYGHFSVIRQGLANRYASIKGL